ncbi:MAG TPA: hypothetical protein VK252_03750 [Solirubrobacteraceae bacterium]|nr:hypothetical protein [Solirubrobacteraceae bacterium]
MASLFLQRVVPGAFTGAPPQRVSLLGGARATALLLTDLPKLRVSLTDSPAGQRLHAHFSHRMWGIRHSCLAQGVLVLPTEQGSYLQGRSRHALRTGINKAQAAGITCRQLDDKEERRAAAWSLRTRMPWMWQRADERVCPPGDAWWAAFVAGGEPVAMAQMTIDREWALLRTFVSTHRASRYLLHTELVGWLARTNVRYLATHSPMAPMLEPALQYWQRLLGYRIFNLTLSRMPLPAESELAGEAHAREGLPALVRVG